jgi:predicted short-subunit dehydrogenase-like oxidoreductase (DUF2520 family)
MFEQVDAIYDQCLRTVRHDRCVHDVCQYDLVQNRSRNKTKKMPNVSVEYVAADHNQSAELK